MLSAEIVAQSAKRYANKLYWSCVCAFAYVLYTLGVISLKNNNKKTKTNKQKNSCVWNNIPIPTVQIISQSVQGRE